MSREIVDVEVSIGVPSSRDSLGVFLHHPHEGGRAVAEAVVRANGGAYVSYPDGSPPRLSSGSVSVRDTNLYVSLGRMYIISPLTLKVGEIEEIKRAIVYLTDRPFSQSDQEEKSWLAVSLPLVINGKGTT